MEKLDAYARIRALTIELNRLTELYDQGMPEVSDKAWDDMYFELQTLENEWNFWCETSPCKRVNYTVINELKKVEHNHPMLSLDKTKNIEDIKAFVGDKDWIAMLKMDGLTCSLLYENGVLIRAETRGDGKIGEDVTHNAMVISSIPKKIPYMKRLVVDGEIMCKLDDFEEFSCEYKNARNFAAGSIRLLDSSECAKRKLTFVAWDLINGYEDECDSLNKKLHQLLKLNFQVVPFTIMGTIDEAVEWLKNNTNNYPIDGIVFKLRKCAEYDAMGRTEHHFRGGIAYKFYDELYATKLLNVEWTLGKTGILTPTAMFETVNIDGSDVNKSSLHNISIIKKLRLTNNCTVNVYKANQIIPQIASCLQDGVFDIEIPKYCPVCGGKTEVIKENESEVLVCKNSNCLGKLLGRLSFFVSKPACNIDGLSEATLEFLINKGWVKRFKDIYYLNKCKTEWQKCSGFGKRSVEKILDAIEKSRDIKLENFITALSIDGVGKSASKTISNAFEGDFEQLLSAFRNKFDWSKLTDIGDKTSANIIKYLAENEAEIIELAAEMRFVTAEKSEVKDNKLSDMSFCITGTFPQSREILKSKLETKGAKFVSSVSKKLDILFYGDKAGSKLAKAKSLGIKIMNYDELIKLLED